MTTYRVSLVKATTLDKYMMGYNVSLDELIVEVKANTEQEAMDKAEGFRGRTAWKATVA